MDQLGQRVQLTVTAVNDGPSTAANNLLDIFLPGRSSAQAETYFLYPYRYEVIVGDSRFISCDEDVLNPQRLPGPVGGNRRKR